MTARENINLRAVDLARFTIVVVDLVILNTALATIQQPLGFGASLLPWIVIACAVVATAALVVAPARTAARRARNAALGMFGGAAVASETIGVLAHRLLPEAPAWHRTIVVHLPAAVLLGGLALRWLPSAVVKRAELELEVKSAMLVTGAITLVVYGLHSGVELGWSARSTLALLGSATIALIVFGWVESRRPDDRRDPPPCGAHAPLARPAARARAAQLPSIAMKPSSTQGYCHEPD